MEFLLSAFVIVATVALAMCAVALWEIVREARERRMWRQLEREGRTAEL